MRIAQVAPLIESVPPKLYGGTERVVSYLTEELVRQGHNVTLFASGDSVTSARLVSIGERALRLDNRCIDPIAHHLVLLETVARWADEFDVIHYHVDYLHYPLSRRLQGPSNVTTLHGRLDYPDLQMLYAEFAEMPVVSISDSQRTPLPDANWIGTVHHGLPPLLHKFHHERGEYFAFLGRISPEKRPDRAIEIAKSVGVPLKIAAKVDKAEREYFGEVVEPLLGHPLVEFLDEIGEDDKDGFLGNALATLFPIDWCEPFGLVMIESLACGTPVLAFRNGSVPEILEHGRTGFIVDTMKDAIDFAARFGELDRGACRAEFDRRFTAARMAGDYVRLYERLISQETADVQSLAGSTYEERLSA